MGIVISHETRIPIKQPEFQGKEGRFFCGSCIDVNKLRECIEPLADFVPLVCFTVFGNIPITAPKNINSSPPDEFW